MKRLLIACIAFLFLGTITNSYAQDRAIKNGFMVNSTFSIPNANYGFHRDDVGIDDMRIRLLYGLQVGNRWYINPQEKWGIAVDVRWVDFGIGIRSISENVFGEEMGRAVFDVGLLRFGPLGTYKIKENMAVDGYFNLRPTLVSQAIVNDAGDGIAGAGFGLTHAAGAAFRINMLSVGFEYVMGSVGVDMADTDDSSIIYNEDDNKLVMRNFKIVVGIKF